MEPGHKTDSLLSFDGVTKTYGSRKVLDGVTLEVRKGEIVFVLGSPSSGKSALLRLALVEDLPSGGSLVVLGHRSPGMKGKEISHVRKKIGTLHQEAKLLKDRSILENVMFPLVVERMKTIQARAMALQALAQVGLTGMENKFPHELSFSEKKRVSVGRALARSPELLLLDEPFSGLGKSEYENLVKLLRRMSENGAGILATCEPGSPVPAEVTKIYRLEEGRLTPQLVMSGAAIITPAS